MKNRLLTSALAILALATAIPITQAAISATIETDSSTVYNLISIKSKGNGKEVINQDESLTNNVQMVEYFGSFVGDSEGDNYGNLFKTPSVHEIYDTHRMNIQSSQTWSWNGTVLTCTDFAARAETNSYGLIPGKWTTICTNCTSCSGEDVSVPMPNYGHDFEYSYYDFDGLQFQGGRPMNGYPGYTVDTNNWHHYRHVRRVDQEMKLTLTNADPDKVYLVPIYVTVYKHSLYATLNGNGLGEAYDEANYYYEGSAPESVSGYRTTEWYRGQFAEALKMNTQRRDDGTWTNPDSYFERIWPGCTPWAMVNGWPVQSNHLVYVRCPGNGSVPLNFWFGRFMGMGIGISVRVTMSVQENDIVPDDLCKVDTDGRVVLKSPVAVAIGEPSVSPGDARRLRWGVTNGVTSLSFYDTNDVEKASVRRDGATGDLEIGTAARPAAITVRGTTGEVLVSGALSAGDLGATSAQVMNTLRLGDANGPIAKNNGGIVTFRNGSDTAAAPISGSYFTGAHISVTGQLKGGVLQPDAVGGGSYTMPQTYNGSYFITTNGATVTLPGATGYPGQVRIIKVISPATSGTVAASGSEQVENASTYALSATNSYVVLQSYNNNWWVIGSGGTTSTGTTTNSTPSYFLQENLETSNTGYENSWEVSAGPGVITPTYSTSGLSMEASQCLKVAASNDFCMVYKSFSPTKPEVWLYLEYRPTSVSSVPILAMEDSSAKVLDLSITSTGKLRVTDGNSAYADTSDSMSANTTYHIWVRYKKGTGSNAIVSAEFATSATKVGSGSKFAQASNGVSTGDFKYLFLGHSYGAVTYTNYYDKIRLATSEIGSNP